MSYTVDPADACSVDHPENCLDPDATPSAITPHEAHDRMKANPAAVVLDARPAAMYAEGHIAGARSLPFDSLSAQTAAVLIPTKETPVLVYCLTGYHAAIEQRELSELGYTDVHDFGGIEDWPYETVGAVER